MIWELFVRPLMFCLPAERAHYFAMGVFSSMARLSPINRMLRWRYGTDDPRLETEVFGIPFANPIGLAAGFDKNAQWFNELSSLGFSHIEVGTITGQAQPGNPMPRLFRLPRDKALINRMGFNNLGSEFAAERIRSAIKRKRPGQVVGINIGKTKVAPLEKAHEDYLLSFNRLYRFADYFTINVSSPNTPGLRQLQDREPLLELVATLQRANRDQADQMGNAPKPMLLKIAPDLTQEQLSEIAEIANDQSLSGIIATNTTISRDGLSTASSTVQQIGAGGMSGAPLTDRSREVVRHLYRATGGRIPIIGIGGIMTGQDAWRMILAGASLVQVYTGFVYGGPATVRRMNTYLLKQLSKHGLSNIREAIGAADRFNES